VWRATSREVRRGVSKTIVLTEIATYSCVEGHTVDETAGGLKSFQTSCQATGKFTAGLSCKPVRCGPPPVFANTEMMGSTKGDQFFGNKLDFHCKAGYSLDQKRSGPTQFVLTCPASGEFAVDGFKGALPGCRPVSAGMAPSVAHGKFIPREMFYGESALITATDGFSLTGKPGQGIAFSLDVTKQGKYSKIETFLPVVCGKPPSISDAKAPKGFKAVYGDVLIYECNDGFSTDRTDEKASASFSIQCESDASFSRVPGLGKCVSIDDCAGITCGPRGTCVDHHKNYTCACESGFEQRMDHKQNELTCGNINDCGPQACGVGKCVDKVNDYKCTCPAGYEQIDHGNDHTCQGVICGTPPGVTNGATSPVEQQSVKAYFPNKIVYQCDEGHTIDAIYYGKNHFSIDCQASKSFTKAEACKPIKCNDVPYVENGKAKKTVAVFNESINLVCNNGYTIDGSVTGDQGFTVTCQANGQFGAPQECKPVTCGEPDNVAFAFRESGSMVYKDSVTYTCFEGYTMDGNKDGKTEWPLTCDKTGKFSKTEQCLPKECGQPTDYVNVLYSSTKDEGIIRYPMNTEVICRDGYTVGGDPTGEPTFTVRCTSAGVFAKYDERKCEPVRCGPVPAMDNATLSKIKTPDSSRPGGNINYEEKAVYKCDAGFTTGGEYNAPTIFNVECLPSGQMSAPTPNNQCRNVNDCEQHTCGPKGRCIDLIGAAPAYTCECDFGFEIQTNDAGEKHCGNKDDCQGKGCGVGTCKDLIGDYTCICPSGHYIGFGEDGSKTCLAVRCLPVTPTISNGVMLSSHTGAVDFPTTLRYRCYEGYSVDGTVSESMRTFQAQCKPQGQLVGMSTCQKISCGAAHVLPYTKLLSPSSPRRSIVYGDEAKYECFDGYTAGGRAGAAVTFQVKCQDSGVLTDPQVCEPVKCGKAPFVPKSRPSIAGDAFFGQNLVYTCDVGYSLTGAPTGVTEFQRHCKKDGGFSAMASAQPCKPMSGGNAPTISNAVMTEYAGRPVTSFPPSVFYPEGLEYRCNHGYSSTGSLSGSTKITARVNAIGQLTPALQTECKIITFVVQGKVKDARNGAQLNGVTARVEGTSNSATVQNGFFALRGLRAGYVTIVYEKHGYISSKKRLSISGNVNIGGIADVSMSPAMGNDEWRAVLKWGSSPSDLDTYVEWGSKKVGYQNKQQGGGGNSPGATLEVDKGGGFGPETLYFENIGKCTSGACDMKYIINDYSRTGGEMLSRGETEVTLYTGLRVAGTFKIKDCPGSVYNGGNWWHVFTLDAKMNRVKWACSGAGLIQTGNSNHTIELGRTNQSMPNPEKHTLPGNFRR